MERLHIGFTGLMVASAVYVSAISNVFGANLPITTGATISGKSFLDQNSNRLLFRGVGFQPVNGVDPLLDIVSSGTSKPNPAIKALLDPKNKYSFPNLHINAIRVYQVSAQSHAKTMSLLAQNGIYVIVGLSNMPYGTNIPQQPGAGQHPYPLQFKARVQELIDEFQAYPNVLSFEVSNEVTDPGVEGKGTQTQLYAASAIKAAANDAKAYMASKGYRAIPVGVAMQDTPDNESTVAQYYASSACNGNPLDYIGINPYRYVPPNGNLKVYEQLVSDYSIASFTIPVVLTEYEAGTTSANRDFLDVPTFYGDPIVSGNISGGFAYQYIANGSGGGSGYSLVKLGKGSSGLNGAKDVKKLQPSWPNNAFKNLAKQYKKMLASAPYASTSQPSNPIACPSNFNPPLCVAGTPNCVTPSTISVTVQTAFAQTYPLMIVQGGNSISPPSPISDSNLHTVSVDPTQVLNLQQHPSTNTWNQVCSVAANSLSANSAVSVPAAAWGGSCIVAPAPK